MGCKSSLEFNIDGGCGWWGWCWGVWWPPWPLGWKGGNGKPPFWGGANGGSNGKFWFDDFSELSFSSHLTTISVAWTSSSSSVKASSLVGCWREKTWILVVFLLYFYENPRLCWMKVCCFLWIQKMAWKWKVSNNTWWKKQLEYLGNIFFNLDKYKSFGL